MRNAMPKTTLKILQFTKGTKQVNKDQLEEIVYFDDNLYIDYTGEYEDLKTGDVIEVKEMINRDTLITLSLL